PCAWLMCNPCPCLHRVRSPPLLVYACDVTTTPDLSKLKAVLPETAVSVDELDVYAIDGAAPSVVMRPRAQGEVATALRAANEAGAAVVPFGGGTQQWLG